MCKQKRKHSAGYGWKNHLQSVLCVGGAAFIHADVQRYARPFDVFFVTRAARRLGVSICFQILEVSCICGGGLIVIYGFCWLLFQYFWINATIATILFTQLLFWSWKKLLHIFFKKPYIHFISNEQKDLSFKIS